MSNSFWDAVIVIVLSIYFDWRTRQAKRLVAQLGEQMEVVHKATNSIVTQLVAKTEAEGVARGIIEERARADARSQSPEGGVK